MGRHICFVTIALPVAVAIMVVMCAATTAAQTGNGYPARIQTGTCSAPGDEVVVLTGVGATVSVDGSPVPGVEFLGAQVAIPLMASSTLVQDASLSAIAEEPHVIAVYSGNETSAQIVACGAIGGILTRQMSGMIMPGDALQVALGSAHGSGFAGIATLQSVEGGQLHVVILLAPIAREAPSAARPSP